MLTKPISETSESLLKIFDNLKVAGQTALGPAIVASLKLLDNAKSGSMLIMCTDGISNIGLGSLDKTEDENVAKFYENLAFYA